MFSILSAKWLAPDVKSFRIDAPLIAKKHVAGQFIILRLDDHGERIPLTIAESDPEAGVITIIVQGVGKTTRQLNQLAAGDQIHDVVGPLGKSSHMKKFGNVVIIGGGVGTAIAYPSAVALKKQGNYIISIVGARNKQLVILESEMNQISDELYITTDDGSYGMHGFVTDKLSQILKGGRKIDYVLAIGPIPMMQRVADVTKPHGIETWVSLNPIMVDGTGMCGGCRATVGGKTVFVCVDGPEFDAHQVDFEILTKRNRQYLEPERLALNRYLETQKKDHACHLTQVLDSGV